MGVLFSPLSGKAALSLTAHSLWFQWGGSASSRHPSSPRDNLPGCPPLLEFCCSHFVPCEGAFAGLGLGFGPAGTRWQLRDAGCAAGTAGMGVAERPLPAGKESGAAPAQGSGFGRVTGPWAGLCRGVGGFVGCLVLLQAGGGNSNAGAESNAGGRLLPRGGPSEYTGSGCCVQEEKPVDGKQLSSPIGRGS